MAHYEVIAGEGCGHKHRTPDTARHCKLFAACIRDWYRDADPVIDVGPDGSETKRYLTYRQYRAKSRDNAEIVEHS